MKQLVDVLMDCQLTIASCESLTAGLFSARVAEIAGASRVLSGGYVTYQSSRKNTIARVSNTIIDRVGVVSAECAKEMAIHVKEDFVCDIGISCTGNAGPDKMEGKEVGLVYIGIAIDQKSFVEECHLEGTRNEIREKVVKCMEKIVLQHIGGSKEYGKK